MSAREPSGIRLADLNPKLEGTMERGVLRFDCPLGHGHKLRVPITSGPHREIDGVRHWHAEGAFPDDLSVFPSINACARDVDCWHGYITYGRIS